MYMDLKLITHNVNGLRDFKAREKYFCFLSKLKKDIILLQETHSTDKNESLWRNQLRADIVFSHGISSSRGVCIIFRKTNHMELTETVKDYNGRFLLVKMEVYGEKNYDM